MRVTAAYLLVLCAIACLPAWADDPPTPGQPPAPTSAAPTSVAPGEKSTTIDAEQKPAPGAASTAITPGVTVVGAKPELTPEEKQLIARGYKLEIRQGEKYFCRREQQIGSRFEVKTCDTAQSIQVRRAESQEEMRTMRNNNSRIGN
jgi:hypothetical protein